MESTTRFVCVTVAGVITVLVVGEVFGCAISRPITAWKGVCISPTKVVSLFDVMNQRISNLEEKQKGQEA